MSVPQLHNFEGKRVRTVLLNGELGWVLADVCKAAEIENSRNVKARLEKDEWGVHSVDTPGGKQKLTIVNLAGLSRALGQARGGNAVVKRFQRWVFHDVIPSVLKHGSYTAPQSQTYEIPQTYADALILAGQLEKARAAEEGKRLAAEADVKKLTKRVEIAEPALEAMRAMEDQDRTRAPSWVWKWIKANGNLPKLKRDEVFAKIKANGWAYKLDGDWVVTETAAKRKKKYVIAERFTPPNGGYMRLTIRLTMAGALRILYDFGIQAIAAVEQFKLDFNEGNDDEEAA